MYLDYFNEFSKRFESEETIKDYLNSLTDFSSYIKKDDIEVITDVDIRKYINYLLDNYKISTAEKKISYIKSYFKFLAESEKIKVNPFAFVRIPRASKNVKQKNILSPDDIMLAIDNLNTLLPVKRLLVYLFLTTGLSVSEMYILKWKDFIADENDDLFLLAGIKEKRVIRLHKDVFNVIDPCRKYLGLEVKITPTDEPVFMRRVNNQSYSKRTIKKVVKDYLTKLNLGDLSSKDLRHTFALYSLIYGSNKLEVKNQLGLKDEFSLIRYNNVLSLVDSQAVKSLEECGYFNLLENKKPSN